jgi:hypothetical protein
MILTCQWTYVNFICGLYEILYKPVYKKFLFLLEYKELE